MPSQETFDLSLRGYDRAQVDRLVEDVTSALRSGEPERRAEARRRIQETAFVVALRGYNRPQVDQFVARALAELS